MTVTTTARKNAPPRAMSLLAHVFGGFGVLAAAAGLLQIGTTLAGGVPNPVFANPRRLPHLDTLEFLATHHVQNVLIAIAWMLMVVLMSILFISLARSLYQRMPLPALMAGIFLGGSAICGMLIGTSELRVSEFAVQAGAAAAVEQAWVAAGMNYLNQLHLFYVWGWVLCVGVGWLFLASAAGGAYRIGARLVLVGGACVTVSAIGRALMPAFDADAPAMVVAMGEPLLTVGFGAGLVGCTLIWRMLAGAGEPDKRGVARNSSLLEDLT